MNATYALNFIRSANAPEMSAGVMTANIIWNATNASAGTVPCACPASPLRPTSSRPPMKPPCVAPKASE